MHVILFIFEFISSFETQSTVSLVRSMTSGLYYNVDHSTLSIFRGEHEVITIPKKIIR